MSEQAQFQDELEQATVLALLRACLGPLTAQDISILCMHCGIQLDALVAYSKTPTIRNQMVAEMISQQQGAQR